MGTKVGYFPSDNSDLPSSHFCAHSEVHCQYTTFGPSQLAFLCRGQKQSTLRGGGVAVREVIWEEVSHSYTEAAAEGDCGEAEVTKGGIC
jgi:hypothetical protein|eukprot:COSAG01_NODE_3837_length_5647_cov_13.474139_4_plen_90_part_00